MAEPPSNARCQREYHQIHWDRELEQDLAALVELALWEDVAHWHDCTTEAIVPAGSHGRAVLMLRTSAVLAGLRAIHKICEKIDPSLQVEIRGEDGQWVSEPGPVAYLSGPANKIFSAERIILNILGRLSGIATLTRQFVQAVQGTRARIFDTRKTTPGWRRLEKYAVRCGGGWNHRWGLYDGILIKDNHLAFLAELFPQLSYGSIAAQAVRKALEYRAGRRQAGEDLLVEVELESLDDFEEVLRAGPDIILLDNMSPSELRVAVEVRNRINPAVELEASGGITLENVRAVAETGVERISVGALTHSAKAIDLSLEWCPRTLGAEKKQK